MSAPILLVFGKLRPERKRSLSGMAAAAKMSLIAVEEPGEALAWLETNDPHCVIVDASAPRLDKIIAKLRSKRQANLVPVLALVQSPDDLFIEQYFSWGGDEIVSMEAGASLLERLKAVPREPPKNNPGRRVVIGDPDKAHCDVIGRAFAQAGFDVKSAIDRKSLEFLVKQYEPPVVVVNATFGELPELIARSRQNRSKAGWVILAARRDFEAQQTALTEHERCVVVGVQSSPWQLLYRANEVARNAAAERRIQPRLHVGSQVLFRASGGDDDDVGVCFNVSLGGMFVRSMAPVAAEQVWLEWRVPHEKTRIRLEGQVVWRQTSMIDPGRASSPLGFGVKFSDYLGSARGHLERAIESLSDQLAKRSLSTLAAPAAPPAPPAVNAQAQSQRPPGVETTKLIEPPTLAKTDSLLPKLPQKEAVKASSIGVGAVLPARPVTIPPRPAGSVVASPPRPERLKETPATPNAPFAHTDGAVPVEAERVAGETLRSGASDNTDDDYDTFSQLPRFEHSSLDPRLLDDAVGPTSSERTDIVKNALGEFDSADEPLIPLGIDDEPTVVTKATGYDALSALVAPAIRAAAIPSTSVDAHHSNRPLEPASPSDILPTSRFNPPLVAVEPEAELTSDFRASKPRRAKLLIGILVTCILGAGTLGFVFRESIASSMRASRGAPALAAVVAPKTGTSSSNALGVAVDHQSKDAAKDAGIVAGATGSELTATVTLDTGRELGGYPPVEEAQAGKGRLLADRYGYLVVRFPEPAFIFSDNIAIGPVNSKIATTCGEKTLRVGVGEKPTTFLSDLGTVNVVCRGITRVIFRRLPGVVAPPGALRPIPNATGPSKATGELKSGEEPATKGALSDVKPGTSAVGAGNEPAKTTSAQKTVPSDEGVVETRE